MNRVFSAIEKIRSQGADAVSNESYRLYNVSFKIAAHLECNQWRYLGSGRHRKVYKRGGVVLKIPLNLGGAEANIMERLLYISRREEKIFAPCRLLSNGCLMMVALTNTCSCCDYDKNHPSWVRELSDGPQIGFDRSGRLMAYDYAEEYSQ